MVSMLQLFCFTTMYICPQVPCCLLGPTRYEWAPVAKDKEREKLWKNRLKEIIVSTAKAKNVWKEDKQTRKKLTKCREKTNKICSVRMARKQSMYGEWS